MSLTAVPAAAQPFIRFSGLLREHGFAVAPEQTVAFMMAVELLGPRSIAHVRRAAVATLAPAFEQRALFDALFDSHFIGVLGEPGDPDWQPDDDVQVQDDKGSSEALIGDEVNETGQAATASEALSVRQLKPLDESETLRRFSRALPEALPRRRGYRRAQARRGPGIDLARSLRHAMRHDGEIMSLKRFKRATRPRPLLLLIDVSGSMKLRTDAHLAFAHALMRAAPRVEVFTFGTRLTRLTRALKLKQRDQALAQAAALVADWDGGTRIGDALQAFLAVPRFAGYARGASVIILSDGLERGDPAAMVQAVQRLAARAWRIDWLSPLAADPAYQPQTEGLAAVYPMLASLADGGSTAALCRHVLALKGARAA
jgi:uncharacterized protein